MATIFEKTADDKCIVLNTRESLVYPFNVGDWTEIRLSAAISFTNSSSDNGAASYEVSAGTIATPKNDFYFGIKKNSYDIPSSGSEYIGVCSKHASNNNLEIIPQAASNGTIGSHVSKLWGIIIPSGTSSLMTVNDSVTANFGGAIPSIFNMTGASSSYSTVLGMRVILSDKNTPFQSSTISFYISNPVSLPTISALSSINASMPSSSSQYTRYFTDNYLTGGNPSSIPDSFYLYSPFFNNRVRIHSLLIEKYA